VDSKLVIAMVSISVGWLLAQLTEVWKSIYKTRKLKSALKAELSDILRKANGAKKYCLEFRDGAKESTNGPITPQPIKTLIFDKFYHEMYTKFKPEERDAISTTYGHIENLNKLISEYKFENRFESYANMYSSTLWAIAWVEAQLENSSTSLRKEKVQEVNEHIRQYAEEMERLFSQAKRV